MALLLPPLLEDDGLVLDLVPAPQLAAALLVEEDCLEDVALDRRCIGFLGMRASYGSVLGFAFELR